MASYAAPLVHTVPQCGPGKRKTGVLGRSSYVFKIFVQSVNDVNLRGRLLSKRTHTKTRRTAALEREQQEADTRPPVFSYLQAAHR